VAVFSPLWGLPLTLLAAVLERPFVSRAGIRTYALTRSIRANLLSWLAGLIFVFLFALFTPGSMSNPRSGYGPVELLATIFFVLAIPVSTLIEGGYYRAILKRQGGLLRWRWVIAANVFSNAVLVAMAFMPKFLWGHGAIPSWCFEVRLLTLWLVLSEALSWILAAICLAIVAFAFRPLRKPLQAEPEAIQTAAKAESPRKEVCMP
jgi:hypothetical protein